MKTICTGNEINKSYAHRRRTKKQERTSIEKIKKSYCTISSINYTTEKQFSNIGAQIITIVLFHRGSTYVNLTTDDDQT